MNLKKNLLVADFLQLTRPISIQDKKQVVEVDHPITIDVRQSIGSAHPLPKKHHDVQKVNKSIAIEVGDAFTFVWNRVAILIQRSTINFAGIKNVILIAVKCRPVEKLAFIGLAVAVAI